MNQLVLFSNRSSPSAFPQQHRRKKGGNFHAFVLLLRLLHKTLTRPPPPPPPLFSSSSLLNMDTLKANYRDEEEDNSSNQTEPTTTTEATIIAATATTTITTETTIPTTIAENQISPIKVKEEPEEIISEEISEGEISDDENEEEEIEEDPQQSQKRLLSKPSPVSEEEEEDDEEENTPKAKKQRPLSSFTSQISPITVKSESPKVSETPETPVTDTPAAEAAAIGGGGAVVEGSAVFRRPKKKANNVWTKSTSRKGKKKTKPNGNNNVVAEDTVLITPFPRFTDKGDDSPDMKICLSKVYKAEQIELSDDRLSAGSSKGYRMVRATRGVMEGAWYFEIKVSNLGETGHTRLGWSTEKGDLQAPVGYFGNGFAYRDVDGSKVHKAVREKYGGEGYIEGDVIGFYINLPEGSSYAPKPPHLVMYKGQRYAYVPDGKEESPKVVPGSEISFFKNGVCQGVAFKDLCGGRYYPAASMYTLPHQPNCVVKFNFGPDFECFPQDFEGRPIPTPMIEIPYHGFDGRVENDESTEKKH